MVDRIQKNLKKQILKRDSFTCQKCGFQSPTRNDLEIHHIILKMDEGNEEIDNLVTLCSICHRFAPNSLREFEIYLSEKIPGKILNTFRKAKHSTSKRTQRAMNKKMTEGHFIARAPFGYTYQNKKLTPHPENAEKVKQIFEMWAQDIDYKEISKIFNIPKSTLYSIIKNIVYTGKVKYKGKLFKGKHKPLIDEDLFKQANKIEN